MTSRIPTDSARKMFFMTRANIVRNLMEEFNLNQDEARDVEENIFYREGHDSFENYTDIALEYFDAKMRNREPFQNPQDGMEEKNEESKVSDKELQSFFEVKLDDIVTGNRVMSRCPRCKSTEIFSTAVQTRSADEGMTLLNKCERCAHAWKE